MTLASAAPALPAAPAVAAAAPGPASITLGVQSLRDLAGVPAGTPITDYKWMINRDDTGDPGTATNKGTTKCLPQGAPGGASSATADLAADCPWPSIRKVNGWTEVVAQGNQADLSGAKSVALDAGKYLISVTADNYKIAGAHFTVDGTVAASQAVVVKMLPTPLPLGTIKIQVYNDSAPIDGTYEADAEGGLQNFTATLADVFGLVSTDYFGNPLCTPYQHYPAPAGRVLGAVKYGPDGRPLIDTPNVTGKCLSDKNGVVTIPNLGEDRYGATIAPPKGQTTQWSQTTTLEGTHDHDIWVQAGDSGLDNEVLKAAEPVPATKFGFVHVGSTLPATGGATVSGHVNAQLTYIAGTGGQANAGEIGLAGSKLGAPIASPWIGLSDLNHGDAQVFVGRGNPDSSFAIPHVPDGSYQLTAWDQDQDYIIYSFNITVDGGKALDVGLVPLVGWFTHMHGTIFVDDNGNGVQDPGEAGVPNFTLTVRERDNSVMDQALNTVTTDDQGKYEIKEAYPLGKFLVLEAFNTRYQTTGITYRGENEKTSTTTLGGLVDFNFLPIIGIGGEVNWGVTPYAKGTNGGIAGTVSYDTTRNELDPKDAVSESYQPGIPGLMVDLFAPVACGTHTGVACSDKGYEIDSSTGALAKGDMIDQYPTEGWQAPKGCTATQWNGKPLTDQLALPQQGNPDITCVEAPMAGVAMGPSDATPGQASTSVNGNYGFSGLAAGDYIVSVEIPDNKFGPHTPQYKVTSEEDVNVFSGDSYVPVEDYPVPPAEAGGVPGGPGSQPLPPQPPSQGAGIISDCVGATHRVKVTNQDFLDNGGSPFEGQLRPSCQDKLVTVRDGQATAPNFNLFTDVPMPTHFWGLTLNDLGLTLDKTSVNYGEAQGMPYVPVGLYDAFGNLTDTTHTDYNGVYEALEPSTGSYNCPLPAGPCPGMYRFVGNDPGGAGAPNPDYNPRFRTIAANFQAWPGLYTVTDEAPTQVASTILTPDTTPVGSTVCDLPDTTPQVFAVDKPVVNSHTATTTTAKTVTIRGQHFGSTPGTLTVNTAQIFSTDWSDTSISFLAPATTGALPITITTTAGVSAYNALTLQVVSGTGKNSANNPAVYEVGPGRTYLTIQAGVNAAQDGLRTGKPYSLVVVYPGTSTSLAPRGEYLENVIVDGRIHVQGVGPGGFLGSQYVPGTIIDGSTFNPDGDTGTNWLNLLASLPYKGDPAVPDAAVVTFLSPTNDIGPSSSWRASFDGFQVTGGIQSNIVASLNTLTGANTTPYGAVGALITQGGGIYVHANVDGLSLTDNVIVGNGGSYAGGIRVGTPYVGNNHNYGIVIAHNQVRDNGGTNLAGGIGLFTGSNGYLVDANAVCGNHSSEYGGGISAFGYMGQTTSSTGGSATIGGGNSFTRSSGGQISHNRVWFNQSYDEGGGVMIAGELPPTPTDLSPGTGPVSIDANVIQANLANDDGGGIRLLQASGSNVGPRGLGRISITNDTIVNNISAHEGGGIAIDDALFVDVTDTTVAKNITTATATTSDGTPAAAGLTTAAVSGPLQAWVNSVFTGVKKVGATSYRTNDYLVSTRLSADGSPQSSWLGFCRPTLLNDVFVDNRAGSYYGGVVTGIGAGDKINWDVQVVDQAAGATAPMTLAPVGTVFDDPGHTQYLSGSSYKQVAANPFVSPYDVTVSVLALRANPQFRQAAIVTAYLQYDQLGDYHLMSTDTQAKGYGVGSTFVQWGGQTANSTQGVRTTTYTVSAPGLDIDGDIRPGASTRYDAGSDQVVP